MKIIRDQRLLQYYLEKRQIMSHFSTFVPEVQLLYYAPGELLTNPFSPSHYLQLVVDGDLLLYEMPDENSTVQIHATYQEVLLLGEIELLDNRFTPFFVEAASDVYSVSLIVDRYRDRLLRDPAFLLHVCHSLSAKLSSAVASTVSTPLKDRMLRYLISIESDRPITDIARLAASFHVSLRQMLRVLRELCVAGILEKRKKGEYILVKKPKI